MNFIVRRRTSGGTTFTLLIFVLLLVSTGLMYYYFNRCQVLETELAKWKTGVKEREPAAPRPTPVAVKAEKKKETFRDFAASLGARLAGTPATEPARKTPPPATPTPEALLAPEMETPAPRREPAPSPVPENGEVELPQPAQPSPKPTSSPRPASQTPTAATTPKHEATPKPKSSPITSLYDLQTPAAAAPADTEPTIRVRAPKRNSTPAARLPLEEQ